MGLGTFGKKDTTTAAVKHSEKPIKIELLNMIQRVNFSSREDWLEARNKGIGASEVAAVVGLNPYETPYQLWLRKTGQTPPKEETLPMRLGHYMEEAVAQCWAHETGRTIIDGTQEDFMLVNPEYPHMQVSPDRLYSLAPDEGDGQGILECKTTQKTIDRENPPQYWFCQLQYLLGVAEMKHGSLAWLTAGRDFDFIDIDFIPDFFQWLAVSVDEFWNKNIKEGIEPDLTTVEDVAMRYPVAETGKTIEASPETLSIVDDLLAARYTRLRAEEEENRLKEAVKIVMGDAEELTAGGKTLVTWRNSKPREKFDTARFKAEHPDLYQQFVHLESPQRSFLLK